MINLAFRDTKNLRFGLGLFATHTTESTRRYWLTKFSIGEPAPPRCADTNCMPYGLVSTMAKRRVAALSQDVTSATS